ncbi:MAG TPA: FixH family protein [Kofleriaceae bacterium]|nr:FixH family protein [Kofleriaceae bacterium]HMG55154.1 FixH family protein [Kofleriaceae bacterium]
MRLLVLSLALTAVAACSGSDAPPDADEALACQTSGRGDAYAVGFERPGQSGLLDFKFVSADPAPPGRNLNTWVIQINAMTAGAAGAPVTGASMIVTPFMPDHQHGAGAYTVQVQAMPDAGQYKLTQINTWMPGYWEITIDAQAGAVHDVVVFKFCIQA